MYKYPAVPGEFCILNAQPDLVTRVVDFGKWILSWAR